jgi:fructoselysine-6-P-deglycase FrlB-like protein
MLILGGNVRQSFASAEIANQPDCWRRAAQTAADHAAVLPRPGESVAVVGCGTSWFMAMAYATLRERAGLGRTDAFAASEVPPGRTYDRLVAISRSGTTTEVVDLLADLGGARPRVVITADPETPISAVADAVIALDYADERSVVQTRFATSTLALLRASLGQDLSGVVADAETGLTAPLDGLVTAGQFSFLGTGWTVALAHEAALKMREAAQAWTEAYPAMEYRHGPISIAEPGRVTWMFGTPPPGLADDVARTGATFVESGRLDPMAHLIVAQRLAVAVAEANGLDPDRPRHLGRSVILDAAGA